MTSFNLFGLTLLTILAAGCATSEERAKKKEHTTIRFHLESNPLSDDSTMTVPVFRQNPSLITVQKKAFLDESALDQAGVVVLSDGGYQIALQLDKHGTFVLDNFSTAYRSKRMAIVCEFPEARWIAAPLLKQRISDGKITFTPDASKEEAERIVNGLKNVIKKKR